jgi:protein-tyrosine phosphatase
MIDLHCHILPGIDDGAQTLAEALDLARLAVANGIREIVATPHIHPGRYANEAGSIRRVYHRFQAELAEHNIPLSLRMAAEVRIGPELMMMLPQDKIPFLGRWADKKVLLLEFPHSHIPPGSDKLAQWLISRNILPMIAHPERNKEVMRNTAKLLPFVDLGCLFQMTAGAVAGAFGSMAQDCAQWLLEEGWVTVLASDAHNLNHRPPNLEPGRAQAARWIGEDKAWILVRDNPRILLSGQSEISQVHAA